MKMNPKWRHSCPKCVYLGTMFHGNNVLDWYECNSTDSSVIARHGDDGPEYWSMPRFMITADYEVATRRRDDVIGYNNMVLLAHFMLNKGESK